MEKEKQTYKISYHYSKKEDRITGIAISTAPVEVIEALASIARVHSLVMIGYARTGVLDRVKNPDVIIPSLDIEAPQFNVKLRLFANIEDE